MPLPDCAIPTPALPLCSPTDAMQRVLRQLCEALLSEGCAQGVTTQDGRLCWHLGPTMFRAQGRCGAFSRYRLTQDSIEIARDHGWQPADLEDVLSSIDAPEAALAALRTDLRRTAELDDLNHQQIPRPPRRHQLGVAQMERALHEGHPYHPCYKARSGFSDTDHLRFGPEAGQRFRLIGLLFHHDLIQQNLPDDDFWSRELGQQEWNRIQGIAAVQGIDLGTGDFALLPIHPWQWDQLAQDPLILAWQSGGQLVMIGEIGDHYSATQSVRTLMNADQPQRAHVKTAMTMRNTSSLRTLIPETVAVAPVISDWLVKVIAADPLLQHDYPLTLLPEYAGIIAGRGTALEGHLAAIWRQSPASLGLADNQMMPFNALSLTEGDGQPLITPWIATHGRDRWLAQLIETAVLPVWHLMVAHGIGLEAHGQNLILQHDNGWPTGLIARDFHDGVEYVDTLLSQPALCPDLAAIDPAFASAEPDQFHALSCADGLRELVMDTLFVFNLADLSDLMQRQFDLPESRFWQRLRARLDRYAADHGQAQRMAALAPFAPQIHAESLITRKIDPDRTGTYRHLIDNPLATAKDS
ncbi:Siderophore synthetase component (plasmid) [Phaeobacter inhibens]|uniref:IucA/IucC family protein n=1 Tax=Phaeobacter inhibens TaxID=221822 RepID=UPI000C9B3733|nr:IucA/IucC family protein [Phaeobacter inhibens]AUQ60865.1 Siderophore synthetase component [Phaeobacter inhibens]AUR13809.1 Siderophore synthetase component [Phaeobacter inhibens]